MRGLNLRTFKTEVITMFKYGKLYAFAAGVFTAATVVAYGMKYEPLSLLHECLGICTLILALTNE